MLRPTALKVMPLPDYALRVHFSDDSVGIFDVSPLLCKKTFTALRDEHVFRTARVNGVTVEWSNGVDICPDDLFFGSIRETVDPRLSIGGARI